MDSKNLLSSFIRTTPSSSLNLAGVSNHISDFIKLLQQNYTTTTAFGMEKGLLAQIENEEETDKDFKNYFNEHLKSHLLECEEERMKTLETASKRARISVIVILVCSVAVAIGLFIKLGADGVTFGTVIFPILVKLGVLVIIMGAIAHYICYKPLNDYTLHIKTVIFPKILGYLGEYEFSPTTHQNPEYFVNEELLPSYDKCYMEDHIKGSYKAVGLEIVESRLIDVRHEGSGKDRRTYEVELFKGILIKLDIDKKLTSQTIIKKDQGSVFNKLDGAFSSLQRVELEDPRFEKIFEVYSSDQVESRYVLTPSFMERLMSLSTSFGGDSIQCSFSNDRFCFMIPIRKNLFEPGSVFEPQDFLKDAKSLFSEMNQIFSIIDVLRLEGEKDS